MKLERAQAYGALRTILAAFSGYLYAKRPQFAWVTDPSVIDAAATLILGLTGFWSINSKKSSNNERS